MFKDSNKLAQNSLNRRGIVRLHLVPLVIWLCALAGTVMLFNTRIQKFEVVGMAHSQTWSVSSDQTGRIKTLHVDLFDQVAAGQVIATLGSEQIDVRIKTINAEIAKLSADLEAAKDRLNVEAQDRRNDLVTEHRRFSANVESARLTILELKAAIEPDKILLKDYQAEIDIEKNLLEKGTISSTYNLHKAQAKYDSLDKRIEKNELLLVQAKDNLAQAIKRMEDFQNISQINPSPDIAIKAISKAINVQEHLIQELVVQAQSLTLKSPADGIVTSVTGRPGEVVTPGQAILTIFQSPTDIIAYASDASHNAIKLGKKVQVVKNGATPQLADSRIVQVGPAMDAVPERLQRNPNMPQWGRPFLIQIPPGMELVPGEKVGIRGLSK